MLYSFLALFWIGYWIQILPPRHDLKRRAEIYMGTVESKAMDSFAFSFFRKLKAQQKKEKAERELSDSLAYIRNIAVVGRSNISAELLMGELADISSYLKPCFIKMASFLQLNDKASAEKELHKYLNTEYAKDLGIFLAGWEELPPEDVLQSLKVYQDGIRQEMQLRQKKKDEIISDLIYLPVVLNCMTVMLNFVYIAFFIEQRELLSALF